MTLTIRAPVIHWFRSVSKGTSVPHHSKDRSCHTCPVSTVMQAVSFTCYHHFDSIMSFPGLHCVQCISHSKQFHHMQLTSGRQPMHTMRVVCIPRRWGLQEKSSVEIIPPLHPLNEFPDTESYAQNPMLHFHYSSIHATNVDHLCI